MYDILIIGYNLYPGDRTKLDSDSSSCNIISIATLCKKLYYSNLGYCYYNKRKYIAYLSNISVSSRE